MIRRLEIGPSLGFPVPVQITRRIIYDMAMNCYTYQDFHIFCKNETIQNKDYLKVSQNCNNFFQAQGSSKNEQMNSTLLLHMIKFGLTEKIFLMISCHILSTKQVHTRKHTLLKGVAGLGCIIFILPSRQGVDLHLYL